MKKILFALPLAFAIGSSQAADIVDTAKAAGSFNTLIAAVQAAGLVDTLKGPGPFTVFEGQGRADQGPHLPRRAGLGDGCRRQTGHGEDR